NVNKVTRTPSFSWVQKGSKFGDGSSGQTVMSGRTGVEMSMTFTGSAVREGDRVPLGPAGSRRQGRRAAGARAPPGRRGDEGFRLNHAKTRVRRRGSRQARQAGLPGHAQPRAGASLAAPVASQTKLTL